VNLYAPKHTYDELSSGGTSTLTVSNNSVIIYGLICTQKGSSAAVTDIDFKDSDDNILWSIQLELISSYVNEISFLAPNGFKVVVNDNNVIDATVWSSQDGA